MSLHVTERFGGPPHVGVGTRIAVVLGSIALVTGCGAAPESDPAGAQMNVLLISIDTLRADHLGCYGYPRATSPAIDAFAGESVRYANVLAPTPWTLPSHVAMLTGRHPAHLGIFDSKSKIPDDVVLLAQPLADAGYQTAAFVDSSAGGYVGGRRGFERGFETFRHAPFRDDAPRRYDTAETVRAAQAWLERRDAERPFFLFLHTKSVHSIRSDEAAELSGTPPFAASGDFRGRFATQDELALEWSSRSSDKGGTDYLYGLNVEIAQDPSTAEAYPEARVRALINMYDEGIAYADHHLGQFFDTLEEMGLRENTVIALTADHGESFLEHRFFAHIELHRELVRVPLLLNVPGRAPAVIEELTALEGIPATLLALADVEHPSGAMAPPLPSSSGSASESEFYSYMSMDKREFYDGIAVRVGEWTLIRDRVGSDVEYDTRLYRFSDDPSEQSPVTGKDQLRDELLERLLEWRASFGAGADELQLDADTIEDLRALGYTE